MIDKDPLKELYSQSELPEVKNGKIALLCVDLQYHDAALGYGIFSDLTKEEAKDEVSYYFNRLEKTVIPNVHKLQKAFRKSDNEVIHIRIESLTEDGRDRSGEHKRIGSHVPPGSKLAEFLPEVAPRGDEIIISKTASSVFNSTNIEYVLRNLKIEQLVIVGVVTNECIETAVRDAGDKGFIVYVPEDGSAALGQEVHQAAIRAMDYTYGFITSTSKILNMLE